MFKLMYTWGLFATVFNVCNSFDEPFESLSFRRNREELIVDNVTAYKIFSLQSNVSEWKSVCIGPVCYSVGLSKVGVEILRSSLNQNETGFEMKSHFVTAEHEPKNAIVFNSGKSGGAEGIVVVSYHDVPILSWMSIYNAKMNRHWTFEEPIEHFNYFKIDKANLLFIVTKNNEGLLYEFKSKGRNLEKRFLQSLPLNSSASSSTFNRFKTDYFLSILQPTENSIVIYKYENRMFSYYSILQSREVTHVTSFNIGFKTFIAINGYNAGLYEFSEYGLKRQQIQNSNLDGITYWLSVPVQTYRDEVLLFAQRHVDHGTHSNNEVDVFVYNGNTFEEHDDITCNLFDEHTSRLTCLAHNKGIHGTSYVVIGDNVGLIVPAPNSSFILFNIHTSIKQILNPDEKELSDLQELQQRLEVIIEEKEKHFEKLSKTSITINSINKDNELINKDNTILMVSDKTKNISVFWEKFQNIKNEIDKLTGRVNNITSNENKTNFATIIVNGKVIFDNIVAEEVEVDTISGQNALVMLEDIVRKDNITAVLRNKTFSDHVQVTNLNAKFVNKIDARNIIFNDENITIYGNVTFKKPVRLQNLRLTKGSINDIFFMNHTLIAEHRRKGDEESEKMNVKENWRTTKAKNIISASLLGEGQLKETESINQSDVHIKNNLTVSYINDVNFTEFLDSICMTNKRCHIPGTIKVAKEVNASKVFSTFLNDLKFPEEYVIRNSKQGINITGHKNFTRTLIANNIQTTGLVNGIDTGELITLATDQNLGNKTFEQFSASEEIRIDGKIGEEFFNQFLPNPTLQEVNEIRSNVVFKNLDVQGNIFLENTFNEENFQHVLNNLIYQDDDQATISSSKTFLKGFQASKLISESGLVDTINISSIITNNTHQNLDVSILEGNVEIENLIVKGKFNGIDTTEIESLIKLTGEESINTTLTFDNLEVAHLEIVEKLNNVDVNDYWYTTGGRFLNQDLIFDKLVIENVTVKGNINGNISGFDLEELSHKYLSSTKDQTIKTNSSIKMSKADSVVATNVNGMENSMLLDRDQLFEYLKQKLNNESITIKDLEIVDNVEINTINNKSFDNISLNLRDILSAPRKGLIFQNDVYVPSIEIKKLSSLDWDDYVKKIVFKNETDVIFSGKKIFKNGIVVEKLIETKHLNDVPLEAILTKGNDQVIFGSIEIEGDMFVDNLNVTGHMNDISVKDFLKTFMVSSRTYTIIGDVMFKRMSQIESLIVHGNVNDKNVERVLNDLAFRNEDIVLKNSIIFKEPVHIRGNLNIKNLMNDVNFPDSISRIVLTTSDVNIDSAIWFTNTVFSKENVAINENLSARLVCGFNTSEWVDKSITMDKGMISGKFTFEDVVINEELLTDFINDIDTRMLIPLRTNQTIEYLNVELLKFVKDIPVGKTVNGRHLPSEVMRTLTIHGNQRVSRITTFENVILVRNTINATFLNNKDTLKIVTTNTDQLLSAGYNFIDESVILSDVTINGSINNINLDKWKGATLKKSSNETQVICKDWKLQNLTFKDEFIGSSVISDLDLRKISNEVSERKNKKLQFESEILNDYENICNDVTFLYEKAKSQIYKFKYFENFQVLVFPSTINRIFLFDFNNTQYMLVNRADCFTDINEFIGNEFVTLLSNISTGQFEQVVRILETDVVIFATRGNSETKCGGAVGTNIWFFDGNNLELKFKMENHILLQESIVPFTFYTLNEDSVTEYKIKRNFVGPIRYRKWDVFDANAAFVPRGLHTGLALRTGQKLIFLNRAGPINKDTNTNFVSEVVIKGSTKAVDNNFIPGFNGDDLVVLNVGTNNSKRALLAVGSYEETIVKSSSDFIKIYDDPLNGKLFDKIATFKPSSLVSMEFKQGETLLLFLENRRYLKIYEYKGIEGFQQRSSIKMKATNLFPIELPRGRAFNSRKAIGVIHENEIRILLAIMDGNKIREDLNCRL